jgi:mono/diheme cytochrome c family protein
MGIQPNTEGGAMNILLKAGVVFAVTAVSASGYALAGGDVEMGKKEYDAKCAVCHGISGKGDGPYVNQLQAGSSDITVLSKGNHGEFPTAAVLMALDGRSQVQAHGPREMPIWGEIYLSEGPSGTTAKEREPYVDERLRALIAYIETLQQ